MDMCTLVYIHTHGYIYSECANIVDAHIGKNMHAHMHVCMCTYMYVSCAKMYCYAYIQVFIYMGPCIYVLFIYMDIYYIIYIIVT